MPIFLKSRISTIPEWLERRYGRGSRLYFSGTTIIANVVVDTAESLCRAVVLKAFFPELELWYTCSFSSHRRGHIYSSRWFSGGCLHRCYSSCCDVFGLASSRIGLAHPSVDFSWEAIRATRWVCFVVNPTHHPISDPNHPGWAPWWVYPFWASTLGDESYIVQRVLGARSVDDARWGALLGGLLKLPVLFIMVLPGLAAKLIFPEITNGDEVFLPWSRSLPIGVIGS